jgi:hypothetical protein
VLQIQLVVKSLERVNEHQVRILAHPVNQPELFTSAVIPTTQVLLLGLREGEILLLGTPLPRLLRTAEWISKLKEIN